MARLEADPLRHPKVTTQFAVEFEAAVERVQSSVNEMSVPPLIIVGFDDAITPPQGSQEFFSRVVATDRTLTIYDGGFHQPILDTNRDEVLADLGDWITNRQRREPSSNS